MSNTPKDTVPPRDVAVLHHMKDTGGAFVSKLADAWFSADPRNQALLYMAFGDYYRQYRDSLYSNDAAESAPVDEDQASLLKEVTE